MSEIAFSDHLHDPEYVRYDGAVVGEVGVVMQFKKQVFVWYQRYFRSYGGGYAMSEGLFEKLESEDVELVYIEDADALVTMGDIEDSFEILPDDVVFEDTDNPPEEPQFLVQPETCGSRT